MTIVPNRATATCQNVACKQKVRLTDELVRELSTKLRATLKCPKCETEFVTTLVPRVKERPTPPPVVPPPAPPPVEVSPTPAGVTQKAPPFGVLPGLREDIPPVVAPKTPAPFQPLVPTAVASEQAPFQPLDPNAAGGSGRTGGALGWWNRLPKKRQNLILAVGMGLAVVFAVGIQFRGVIFPPKPEEQEARTEPVPPITPPTTPATTPTPPPSRPTPPAIQSGERVQSNTRPAAPKPGTQAASGNPFNTAGGR